MWATRHSVPKESLPEIIYDVPYDSPHVFKCFSEIFPVTDQTRISELYHDGRIHFHCHFTWSIKSGGEIKANDFCITFERLPDWLRELMFKTFPTGTINSKSLSPNLRFCQNEQAMLVDVVEFREDPQDRVLRRINSLVRLQLLQGCKGFLPHEGFDFVPGEFLEVAPILANGGSNFAFSFSSGIIHNSKLKRQMIESGAQIVNAIPDDQRQQWIEWFSHWGGNCKLMPLRLLISGNGALVSLKFRAQKSLDSRVDLLEIVICSIDLGANAG